MGKRLRKHSIKQPALIETCNEVHIDIGTEGAKKRTRTYSFDDGNRITLEPSHSLPATPDSPISDDSPSSTQPDGFREFSDSELAAIMRHPSPDKPVVVQTADIANPVGFPVLTTDTKIGMLVGSEGAQIVHIGVDDGGLYTVELATGAGDYIISADNSTAAQETTDVADDSATKRLKSEPPSSPCSADSSEGGTTGGEISRFVICSFGQMDCELCDFFTVDYSTFKSHIICSHPSWRITKKLSKNRLLVEKCARSPSQADYTRSLLKAVEGVSSDMSDRSPVKTEHVESTTVTSDCSRRMYRCRRCLELFSSEKSASQHCMSTTTVVEPTVGLIYRCQICGYTATSSEQVQSHAERMHHPQLMMFGLSD